MEIDPYPGTGDRVAADMKLWEITGNPDLEGDSDMKSEHEMVRLHVIALSGAGI
jgi:hypothetical protein